MPITVKMDDSVYRKLRIKLTGMQNAHVKVGVLESGHAGEDTEDGELTLAELLAIHEFGAPRANIPAREPLRRTFTEPEAQEEISKQLNKLAQGIIADRVTVDHALELLGQWAATAVKKRITTMGLWPPNRPETVRRKGSSTPLVDTGQLVNAFTYEVKR